LRICITSAFSTVAREVKHRHAPVQCDADPALGFGVDFRAKPIQGIHYVLHFEIGIEWMGEDRMENFALMVVHGRASLRLIGSDKIWANDTATSSFGARPMGGQKGRLNALIEASCAGGKGGVYVRPKRLTPALPAQL
jgi:hypothetical protein